MEGLHTGCIRQFILAEKVIREIPEVVHIGPHRMDGVTPLMGQMAVEGLKLYVYGGWHEKGRS
jgi:hypothetical protein